MKRYMKVLLLIPLFALPLLFLAYRVRQAQAARDVAEDWEQFSATAPELMTTSRLEIVPLYENASTSPDLISGSGVSYLVRTDSATILMDVGDNPDKLASPPFVQNMQKLGISWDEVYRVVITHLHPDHVGGLGAWRQDTIALGDLPGVFDERLVFVPAPVADKGAVHATIPTLPAPDVATTGVISFLETWPMTLFALKGGEQALVVHVAGHGLVLITGCGHPGLERLVERAESLYGERVVGVVGGLHYGMATAEELQPQIRFLESRAPELVALSPHDSAPPALDAFAAAFPDAYHTLTVGEVVRFP